MPVMDLPAKTQFIRCGSGPRIARHSWRDGYFRAPER
jgi:hypothetical protein